MITIYITIPLVTFAVGFIAGVGTWKMATNQKIEILKSDAKTSIEKTAQDEFAAGYMRAYADKVRHTAMNNATRMTAETQIMSLPNH